MNRIRGVVAVHSIENFGQDTSEINKRYNLKWYNSDGSKEYIILDFMILSSWIWQSTYISKIVHTCPLTSNDQWIVVYPWIEWSLPD